MNVCPECGMSMLYSEHRKGCALESTLPTMPQPANDPAYDKAVDAFGKSLAVVLRERSKAALTSDLLNAGYEPGTATWDYLMGMMAVGVGIGSAILLQMFTEQGFLNDDALEAVLNIYTDDE